MLSRLASVAGFAFSLSVAAPANALEIPPPSGKGPLVVMVSGQSGLSNYVTTAQKIAQFGYDVILLDGNDVEGSQGQKIMAAITQGEASPHVTPGKAGVIGFSLGGGEVLGWASHWSKVVAAVVVWYPATVLIANPASFGRGITVPVLMFAGENDTYKNCCLIATARTLSAAAKSAGAPLDLVTYPGVGHGFTLPGRDYDAHAATDSFQRVAQRLAQYLH
jgi:dienelactone hydrolase